MSELRAPDPTLTAHLRIEGQGADVAVAMPYADRAVAHRIVGRTTVACGKDWAYWYTHPVFAARWFCRPCRKCWPDAPEVGRGRECLREGCDVDHNRHLSWQVSGGSI